MRADALWVNVHLATLADSQGYGIIEDGAIAVREGRITWLGRRVDIPAELVPDRSYDGGGRWLTPGLIDCHTHLVWAGSRVHEFDQRLQGASYAGIAAAGGGILATVRATRSASDDELCTQSAQRLRALLAEGVTTVEIKSGYGLDAGSERRMLGVARRLGETHAVQVMTSFLGAHALPPEYAGRADGYIDFLCRELMPELHAEGLIDAVDAYCERIAFTPRQVARLFDAACGLGLPVRLHADQLSDTGGARLAAKYRALSADHLEYSNEDGIRAMADAGTAAVLLPGAYYTLRETRPPPVALLRLHGAPIALATDCNPGTSYCMSPLLIMNMACTLFGMTPAEALAGFTRNAARALGLHADRGQLAAGMRADFALWQIPHPAELAYALGARCHADRVVGGKAVEAS
jgi:imidazolonepropionase